MSRFHLLFLSCFNLIFVDISIATNQNNNLPFTICSQNLFRFAENKAKKPEVRTKQKNFLIQRFIEASCDIIALQEVYGESQTEATDVMQELVSVLQERSDRKYSFFLGQSLDPYIRNGFIYAEDRIEVINKEDYLNRPLLRLNPRGQITKFIRAPIALLLKLREKPSSAFYIINYHFKSKAGGYKDPTKTNYEAMRLEMAEGVRNIIEQEMSKFKEDTIVVALGDRNSDINNAASIVLSGRRELKDFQIGNCSIDLELDAECQEISERKSKLIGLFEYRKKNFLGKYLEGSYQFRGRQEFLDEIYLREKDLDKVRGKDGNVNIGLTGQFYKGSDHKLVWVRF